jgi:hypothetical protein
LRVGIAKTIVFNFNSVRFNLGHGVWSSNVLMSRGFCECSNISFGRLHYRTMDALPGCASDYEPNKSVRLR